MTDEHVHGWDDDQEWERSWWGSCCNTFAEETKQITYAHRMGLKNEPAAGRWPLYDLRGKSVLDIGGGPTSMLLKTVNGVRLHVADPCKYPAWVAERYKLAGITYTQQAGEDLTIPFTPRFDEVWIYNVLQHVQDPEAIIRNARMQAPVLRIFEWVYLPPHIGHPHELRPEKLREWIGTRAGDVVDFREKPENGCNWIAFTGCFVGK